MQVRSPGTTGTGPFDDFDHHVVICKAISINIVTGKITLNREKFPEWKPDDFVQEFCRIMESCLVNVRCKCKEKE